MLLRYIETNSSSRAHFHQSTGTLDGRVGELDGELGGGERVVDGFEEDLEPIAESFALDESHGRKLWLDGDAEGGPAGSGLFGGGSSGNSMGVVLGLGRRAGAHHAGAVMLAVLTRSVAAVVEGAAGAFRHVCGE